MPRVSVARTADLVEAGPRQGSRCASSAASHSLLRGWPSCATRCQRAADSRVVTSTRRTPEVAGPRRAAHVDTARAGGIGDELGAARRIGDDRAHRHRLEDAQKFVVGRRAARHHRLDRDAIGRCRPCRGRRASCRASRCASATWTTPTPASLDRSSRTGPPWISGSGFAVHLEDDAGVLLHRLGERHAARDASA